MMPFYLQLLFALVAIAGLVVAIIALDQAKDNMSELEEGYVPVKKDGKLVKNKK